MAYSDFSLADLEDRFGLVNRRQRLFADIPPLPLSAPLQESLQQAPPLPLKTTCLDEHLKIIISPKSAQSALFFNR